MLNEKLMYFYSIQLESKSFQVVFSTVTKSKKNVLVNPIKKFVQVLLMSKHNGNSNAKIKGSLQAVSGLLYL